MNSRKSLNIVTGCVAGMCLIAMSTSIAPAAQKRALIVSIENYSPASGLEPIVGANRDANRLAEVLRGGGFGSQEILRIGDGDSPTRAATKSNILSKLDAVIARSNKDDTLLVFVTSHGIVYEGKSYLCPVDTTRESIASRSPAAAQLIPVEQLTEKLAKCPAANKLLVVDACRNDGGNSTFSFVQGLQHPPQGVWLLSSCSSNQRSYISRELEPGETHAIFTYYVTEGLRGQADRLGNNDGQVSLCELNTYAFTKTQAAAQAIAEKQSPELFGNSVPFHLARVAERRMVSTVISGDAETERKVYADMLGEQALQHLRLVHQQFANSFKALISSSPGRSSDAAADKLYSNYHEQVCYVLGQYIAPALKMNPNCKSAILAKGLALRAAGEHRQALDQFNLAGEQFSMYVKGSVEHLKNALSSVPDHTESDDDEFEDAEPRGPKIVRVPLYAKPSKSAGSAGHVALHAKITIDDVVTDAERPNRNWLRVLAINDRAIQVAGWIESENVHWVAEAADVYIPASPLGGNADGYDIPSAFSRMEATSNRLNDIADRLEAPGQRMQEVSNGLGFLGRFVPIPSIPYVGEVSSRIRGYAGYISAVESLAGSWGGVARGYGEGIERTQRAEMSRERLIRAKNLDRLEEKPIVVRSLPWIRS